MTQIKKNFIYNMVYQILVLILPLITVPYVSRVLNADGIGIYSYTYSIVYYFMLFAMLGINNYGNRTIAKIRNDKNKLSKEFLSIYYLQCIISFIMIIFYTIYILFFCNEYKLISTIQIIHLISSLFDINWFFFGLEKFKLTVTRSTILKLITLFFIFKFVNSPNDLWIYTLIISSSTLINQLLLLPFLKKEIIMVKVKISEVIKHLKPCLILFLPVVAMSLYKIMDKIMLGNFSSILEVGYYEQAEKIINIPMSIVTALGTVMLPRISNLVSEGNNKLIMIYIKKSIAFMMFLAFPICFGLIAISSDFVPLFLGSEFFKTSELIYYLAPTILFISFANVIRTQYLIPNEKDNIFVMSLFGGALVNLLMNLLLIPKYGSIGAAIGTLFAELFVFLYQIISVKKQLEIKVYLKQSFNYLYKSIIMFVIIILIKKLQIDATLKIFIQIFTGVIIYLILNIGYIKRMLIKKG